MASVAANLLGSGLSRQVDFVPLDSLLPSAAAHGALLLQGVLRGHPAFPVRPPGWGVDAVLVFVSDGTSWLEKGVMVVLARSINRGVVLRTGGAVYDRQCEQSRLFRRWVGFVLRHCHVVCSQGPRWTAFFNTFPGVSGEVMETPNPIDLPDLSGRPGPSPSRFHMVHVGWMIPRKGVFEALRVFETVRKAHPEATFTLAGGGELLEEFREKAAATGAASAPSAGCRSRRCLPCSNRPTFTSRPRNPRGFPTRSWRRWPTRSPSSLHGSAPCPT